MAQPIDTVFGNVVYRDGLRDPWAVFRVQPTSYGGLARADKERLLGDLAGFCAAAECDLQILRLAVCENPADYPASLPRLDASGHPGPWARLVESHTRRMAAQPSHRVAVFVAMRLADPELDLTAQAARVLDSEPSRWAERAREALAMRATRRINPEKLAHDHRRAESAFERIVDYLDARPARLAEMQWLIRRCFCRGLGEPEIEDLHAPQALAFVEKDGASITPLEGDVMRWCNSQIRRGARELHIQGELGESIQTLLCLGAVPARSSFPGWRAELLFAPLEDLAFPVDACLSARWLANDQAGRLVRRRVVDAAQVIKEESAGDHAPQDLSYERHDLARQLQATLSSGAQPPLLRSTVTFAFGAVTHEQRAERLEALRRAYGEVKLHLPLGEQLQCFLGMLPGQSNQVAGYEDYFLPSQVGAMVPTATREAGSRGGPYLGHVLARSRRPVRFELREGSVSNKPVAILALGTLGSGKTALSQLLYYHGFCQGARIVDIDPKGDHRFHTLPEVAPHSETIDLKPTAEFRGLLDPLRVSPAEQRQETTVAFLTDVLPQPVPQDWKTAIVKAVRQTSESQGERATCRGVVDRLAGGDQTAMRVGEALEVYATAGLSQLGFADTDEPDQTGAGAQVSYIPIRSLPLPEPGVARSELSEDERVGRAIVRLLALYAMRLMGAERDRLKLLGLDEAWMLMADAHGRRLIEQLNRWGRSELAVPILSTHMCGDVAALENLLGPRFVFRMSSESEARSALGLLGLEDDEQRVASDLLSLATGQAYFRDHSGRVEAIAIDFCDPELLNALSTTPNGQQETGAGQ